MKNHVLRFGRSFALALAILLVNYIFTDISYGFSVKTARVKVNRGHLYEKPGTNAAPITELKEGELLTLIYQTDEWYIAILPDERLGWAHQSLFSSENLQDRAEQKEAEKQLTINVPNGLARVEPSVESQVKFRLKKGDIVTFLQTKGDWYLIKLKDGSTGWSHQDLFSQDMEEASSDNNKVKTLKEIRADVSAEGEERIVFALNGFYPPETFVLEDDVPKIVCDFFSTQLEDNTMDRRIEVNGQMVQRIRIGIHTNPPNPKLRVVIDLVPHQTYEVERTFFQKENLYILTFNLSQKSS